jgi:hypothetical protein
MGHSDLNPAVHERRPWNAGKNVGPKRPLKPRDIWAIRFYLDEHKRLRDRALFDLAIDSKLRGCDLVKLRIGDVASGGQIRNRATVIQQKARRPSSIRDHDRDAQEPGDPAAAPWRNDLGFRLPKPSGLHGPPQYPAIRTPG